MITSKTALDLCSIANAGGSLEVDGNFYTPLQLGSVASALKPGAILQVMNSDRFTALECISIVSGRIGQVVFS